MDTNQILTTVQTLVTGGLNIFNKAKEAEAQKVKEQHQQTLFNLLPWLAIGTLVIIIFKPFKK